MKNLIFLWIALSFAISAFAVRPVSSASSIYKSVKNHDGSIRLMVQSSEYMKQIGRPLPGGELGAQEFCSSVNKHLPSEEELLELYRAERIEEGWFWLSAVNPNYLYKALIFNGIRGTANEMPRGGWSDYVDRDRRHAVICLPGQ
jgi:hypothetical protein